MAKIYDAIRDLGGEVLAISFTRPERTPSFLEKFPQPFPFLCDPKLESYRAFSLGRVPLMKLFRPGVLWRFVKLVGRGWLPTGPAKGDDILQLGGDFILSSDGRLLYSYPSREPTDRPDSAILLAEMKKAAATP